MNRLLTLLFIGLLGFYACDNANTSKKNNPVKASIEERNISIENDSASLAIGHAIYDENCAVCHADDGGGIVGPNFCDAYWIHGNSMEDLTPIVEHGVYEKGMIAYKNKLNKDEIQDVLSYIMVELNGSVPKAGKAPEGKEYK